jgi:hypothetical protein
MNFTRIKPMLDVWDFAGNQKGQATGRVRDIIAFLQDGDGSLGI